MAAGNAKDWPGPEHICLQQDLNYLCAEKVLPQQAGQTIEKWYSFMLVSVNMWLLLGFTLEHLHNTQLISATAALQAGHVDI